MKQGKVFLLIVLAIVLLNNTVFSEIIDEIYAVVNDEVITYTELLHFEKGMIAELKTQLQGKELEKAIANGKITLLDQLIERKLILSKAKEQNYDIEQYLEIVIKEIMKNNNITRLDELKTVLKANDIDYEEWRKIRREELLSQSLVQNEIGQKVKLENSELMDFYRKNKAKYTNPPEFTLNCIFLSKENYFTPSAIKEKQTEIDKALAQDGIDFITVAKKYSELPNQEKNYYLGKFKKGELNSAIEDAALKLDINKHSSWLETPNGWYIIQLLEHKKANVTAFKDVRQEIESAIKEEKMQVLIKEYVAQLKKDSYIKIYKEYK